MEAPELWLGAHKCEGAQGVLSLGADIANELATIIKDKGLYKNLHGKNHVMVEGWGMLAAMLGLVPSFREVRDVGGDGNTFEATVDLLRSDTGERIGGASAICGGGEKPWVSRDVYTRSSMAQTRAVGKAVRMSYSWIVKLAGYEATPAEEMPANGDSVAAPPSNKAETNKYQRRETLVSMEEAFVAIGKHSAFVDLLGNDGCEKIDEAAALPDSAFWALIKTARARYAELKEEAA